MKKIFIALAACLLLSSCSKPVENEEEAVLKVAVHDAAYKEALEELWNETYPDAVLEVSVVSEEEISSVIMEQKLPDYDVFWIEDEYIPAVIDSLMELDDEVEVELNRHFNDIFDLVKKVYQPLMAKGNAYYALDLNKIESDGISLDVFSSMEEIGKLENGFYYLDEIYFTSAFLTSNINYFPGKEKAVINFTGDSFKEALEDYQKILELIECDDPAAFDNWFIQNSYYSGFVTDAMQLKQDEEVNQGKYQIVRLPQINDHALYTQAVSYGYVVSKDTEYPNAAQNLLYLMHSVEGMQLLCGNDELIPLIPEELIEEFSFENIHVKEKALALNYAVSRNWIGIENKTDGALDYLYLDSTLEKLKACDLEKTEECQKELDEEYQEWLK